MIAAAGPPPTKGIRHVALFVRDMEVMERFYRDVLGYAEEWRPSECELYMTRGSDNLALHAVASGVAGAGEGPRAHSGTEGPRNRDLSEVRESRLDHIGLVMSRPEDVDAWAEWLESNGVHLDTRPRQHRDGARSFYARDPEGNRIQFIWHPPIADK